jgi:hypothetical protein
MAVNPVEQENLKPFPLSKSHDHRSSSIPMTITYLSRILNMAAYLVLSGDIRLKPLDPGDTDEG